MREIISPEFGVDPNKIIKLGGYCYVKYQPQKYLGWLSRFCKWVLRPEAVHKATRIMIFKDNGVYSLDCDDKVRVKSSKQK